MFWGFIQLKMRDGKYGYCQACNSTGKRTVSNSKWKMNQYLNGFKWDKPFKDISQRSFWENIKQHEIKLFCEKKQDKVTPHDNEQNVRDMDYFKKYVFVLIYSRILVTLNNQSHKYIVIFICIIQLTFSCLHTTKYKN